MHREKSSGSSSRRAKVAAGKIWPRERRQESRQGNGCVPSCKCERSERMPLMMMKRKRERRLRRRGASLGGRGSERRTATTTEQRQQQQQQQRRRQQESRNSSREGKGFCLGQVSGRCLCTLDGLNESPGKLVCDSRERVTCRRQEQVCERIDWGNTSVRRRRRLESHQSSPATQNTRSHSLHVRPSLIFRPSFLHQHPLSSKRVSRSSRDSLVG